MAKNNASPTATSLFPILPAPLHGLARLANDATHVADGHNVQFKALEIRSILNKSLSRRQLSLAWSINPYRGCEFGCRYCYARYTHEFLAPAEPSSPDLAQPSTIDQAQTSIADQAQSGDAAQFDQPDLRDPLSFERVIFLKENAPWLLEQELRRIDPADEIALGTATDPYQPIERTALVTRSLLEVFARKTGFRLGIVTKSRLIERDVDLLQQIARQNTLVVHLTITTPDTDLARLLEPRAPRPDLRFQAVRRLRDAGITTGILCSPLLPGITDSLAALDRMAARAAYARASFFAAQPLFLKQCSRPTYLSFVREHFPHLVEDHERRFASMDFAAQPYRQQMAALVTRVCRRHGLAERSSDALLTRDTGRRPPQRHTAEKIQTRLFA